jgi:hypothetical protein
MAKRNLPTAPVVPLELWRALYQAASEFQLLAPWRWMDDRHVLGINSALGVRLVTVMGSLGEVFGLAESLGIRLRQVKDLPMAAEALRSLQAYERGS